MSIYKKLYNVTAKRNIFLTVKDEKNGKTIYDGYLKKGESIEASLSVREYEELKACPVDIKAVKKANKKTKSLIDGGIQ